MHNSAGILVLQPVISNSNQKKRIVMYFRFSSQLFLKLTDILTDFLVSFLKNFHCYRQDIRAFVRHDISITEDMNHILKISLCNI